MLNKVVFIVVMLLLCSSCVSRTTYGGNNLDGSKKPINDKKLVWFWDEDF